MKIIWQTEFRCDTCQRKIVGQLVCEPEEESPQDEKSRGLNISDTITKQMLVYPAGSAND